MAVVTHTVSFDPAHYVDFVTALGYRPMVVVDETKPLEECIIGLVEWLPDRSIYQHTDEQRDAYFKVRRNYFEVPGADIALALECIKRRLAISRAEHRATVDS